MSEFYFEDKKFSIGGYAKQCSSNCGLNDIAFLKVVGPLTSKEHLTAVVNSDAFMKAFIAKFGNSSVILSDNLNNTSSLERHLDLSPLRGNAIVKETAITACTGDIMAAIVAGKKWTYMCSPLFENPVHPGSSLLMVMLLITNSRYLHSTHILRNMPITPPTLSWTKRTFANAIKQVKTRFSRLRVNIDDRFKEPSKVDSPAVGAGTAQQTEMPLVQGWS